MTRQTNAFLAWLAGFRPAAPRTRPLEWGRAILGTALGVFGAALLCSWLYGPPVAFSLLGPAGASAILLFTVPSGTLSQPWSLVGSYLTAALVAASAAHWLGHDLEAACLALTATLLLMHLLRCLHPPGAAVAFCVILAPALADQGYAVVAPIMLYAFSLLGGALLFNNLSGVPYPRLPAPAEAAHGTADRPTEQRIGIGAEDLDRALAEFDAIVDLTREDLETLIRRTERHALRRHMGELSAAQIMSRDLRWATPDTSVDQALQILQYHHFKALPVLDGEERLVGIVSLADLIEQDRGQSGLFGALGRRRAATVAQAMTTPVISVGADAHVVELISLLSRKGLHCLPVVERGRLVGLISQTDLIAELQRQLLGLLGEREIRSEPRRA